MKKSFTSNTSLVVMVIALIIVIAVRVVAILLFESNSTRHISGIKQVESRSDSGLVGFG